MSPNEFVLNGEILVWFGGISEIRTQIVTDLSGTTPPDFNFCAGRNQDSGMLWFIEDPWAPNVCLLVEGYVFPDEPRTTLSGLLCTRYLQDAALPI